MDEDYNAGDNCGRCGCARREHSPACASHPKCKSFSDPKAQKIEIKDLTEATIASGINGIILMGQRMPPKTSSGQKKR